MSYAVIKTGGKQYRVIEGQTLLIERLPDDVGATVALQPLLLAGDGDPVFEGDGLSSAAVEAEIVEHLRGPKLRVFKFKPKRGLQAPHGSPPGTDAHPHHVDQELGRNPMAHKKGLGSSRNGRDSNAKRLGVKVFAGQTVTGGEIIVRQRGTRFKPGNGVGIGKDDTIYARAAGTVDFREGRRGRVISVVPAAERSEPGAGPQQRARAGSPRARARSGVRRTRGLPAGDGGRRPRPRVLPRPAAHGRQPGRHARHAPRVRSPTPPDAPPRPRRRRRAEPRPGSAPTRRAGGDDGDAPKPRPATTPTRRTWPPKPPPGRPGPTRAAESHGLDDCALACFGGSSRSAARSRAVVHDSSRGVTERGRHLLRVLAQEPGHVRRVGVQDARRRAATR